MRGRTPKIVPLHPVREIRADIATDISRAVDDFLSVTQEEGTNFAGLAVVLWSEDGTNTAFVKTDPRFNNLPSHLIPDFVKGRLRSDYVADFAVDLTFRKLGMPPPRPA